MKKMMLLTVCLILILSGCGESPIDNYPVKSSTVATESSSAPPTEVYQKYETLQITLNDLIDILRPTQELDEIAIYETKDFTVSKEGSSFWGTICFSYPGSDNLSTVLFLSSASSSSVSFPRKAASNSQKALAEYCSNHGIEVILTNHQIDDTIALGVTARDCVFDVESLPLSVREFRLDSEFLNNDERRGHACNFLNSAGILNCVITFLRLSKIMMYPKMTSLLICWTWLSLYQI